MHPVWLGINDAHHALSHHGNTPDKTMKVSIMLEGFTDSDDRANIKMEVTGFTLR